MVRITFQSDSSEIVLQANEFLRGRYQADRVRLGHHSANDSRRRRQKTSSSEAPRCGIQLYRTLGRAAAVRVVRRIRLRNRRFGLSLKRLRVFRFFLRFNF